ncbi:MAG TPA: hypothetical protein VLA09_10780 [Longimicrobiales bacterium]|nr:hypothetical protein [Longimicrobiales bacterium]
MPSSGSPLLRLLALISPYQYVAACVGAIVLRPTSFLLVTLTVVIVYHFVLSQVGFVEVAAARETDTDDGHVLLTAYRRASPVLVVAGLLLHLVEVPPIGEQLAGVLVATGAGLILGVKTITFAGTGA